MIRESDVLFDDRDEEYRRPRSPDANPPDPRQDKVNIVE